MNKHKIIFLYFALLHAPITKPMAIVPYLLDAAYASGSALATLAAFKVHRVIKNWWTNHTQETNDRLNALNNQINTFTSQTQATLNQRLDSVDSNINTFKTTITDNINTVDTRMNTLNGQMQATTNQITTIGSDVQTFHEQNSKKFEELRSNYTLLQEQAGKNHAELRTANLALLEQSSKHHEELRSANLALLEQAHITNQNTENLKIDNEQLKGQLAAVINTISTLSSDIEQLKKNTPLILLIIQMTLANAKNKSSRRIMGLMLANLAETQPSLKPLITPLLDAEYENPASQEATSSSENADPLSEDYVL